MAFGSRIIYFCRLVRFAPTFATRRPKRIGEYLELNSARHLFETVWHEDELGIVTFTNQPKLGIGPSGYLVPHPDGNIFFESCGVYSEAALETIAQRGGIRWLCFSHPHAYGAAWQLQERFEPQVAVQVEDLPWTGTLSVNTPFDEQLELGSGATLIHTGGHFNGHSILFFENKKILFAGDMLKFHFDGKTLAGISTHKAFNRRVPMSHDEIKQYQAIVEMIDFEHIYTTFERAPDGCRDLALQLFEKQLSGPPFFGPMAVKR